MCVGLCTCLRMSNGLNVRVRAASHSGSWYSDSASCLRDQLDRWLEDARGRKEASVSANVRAIISPHAGYRYCGSTAGFGFSALIESRARTLFVLGPSHHVRLSGCALSQCRSYSTPLGDLEIEANVNNELLKTGLFELIGHSADEDEHSIEMQMPFIARCVELSRRSLSSVRIVPVMVGSLSLEKERRYGRLFARYLNDASSVFVISSDFCHWGQRFRYTHIPDASVALHKAIQQLDEQGMRCIESLDHASFSAYLRETGNTICGRHPIGVLMGAIQHLVEEGSIRAENVSLKFLDYSQSNACRNERDSSVSYASATLTFH